MLNCLYNNFSVIKYCITVNDNRTFNKIIPIHLEIYGDAE